ncbi:hypothetical protein MUK42_34056 [Musa troglodytarum]|uniref:Uncharacterized protein n=1 Tax=Musa troglodytarum TaxID=320322 RepID=A0A9E7K6R7_9LILI|nr:hypothetical protein MUK42_34056 [Musa troglodytarum]
MRGPCLRFHSMLGLTGHRMPLRLMNGRRRRSAGDAASSASPAVRSSTVGHSRWRSCYEEPCRMGLRDLCGRLILPLAASFYSSLSNSFPSLPGAIDACIKCNCRGALDETPLPPALPRSSTYGYLLADLDHPNSLSNFLGFCSLLCSGSVPGGNIELTCCLIAQGRCPVKHVDPAERTIDRDTSAIKVGSWMNTHVHADQRNLEYAYPQYIMHLVQKLIT